jgi:hypothetical protein
VSVQAIEQVGPQCRGGRQVRGVGRPGGAEIPVSNGEGCARLRHGARMLPSNRLGDSGFVRGEHRFGLFNVSDECVERRELRKRLILLGDCAQGEATQRPPQARVGAAGIAT